MQGLCVCARILGLCRLFLGEELAINLGIYG